MALAEGAQDRARRLREAKQQLFSTYLRLVAALKNPASPEEAPPVEAVQAQSERLDQLLEQCASGDAVAEAERGKASKDEVCLDAMKRLRRRAPELTPAMGAAELRRERRRLTLLTSIAATLAVICAGVYAVLLGGRTADPVIPLAELPTSAAVSRAVTVGPMMYTQVSSSVWEGLSEGERLAKVDELGSSAGERGLRTVYVTDESNTDLAHWSRTDGSRLAEPQVE